MNIELTVNGNTVTARADECLIEVAHRNGIEIPALCYHKDFSVVGSCRICMVEVDGKEAPACALSLRNGMVIRTETPGLVALRRLMLRLLLEHYVPGEPSGTSAAETEFERWLKHYGVETSNRVSRRFPVDSDPHPCIRVDLNKCILCTRCVRACAELQGRFVWGVSERSDDSYIIAGSDTAMLDARCESCGACVAYCPTGALDDRMSLEKGQPDAKVTTTCPYCGVGCNFDLNIKQGRITRVTSTTNAPVNGMSLCVKGRYGYDFVHHPDRLTRPRVRQYLLDGKVRTKGAERGPWVDVSWDKALDIVAHSFFDIAKQSGPDAIALMASAKCTNEENYLMQKLARQVIGTNNIDHCARLCHSSTVAGLAMAFGSGAMSNTMVDIAQHAQALFVIGSNTTEQHPVFGTMLRQSVLIRQTKLVVADPRKIELTEFAALHLQHQPGTDIALLNGLMHIILDNGWQDQHFIAQRTEAFEALRDTIINYPPEKVSEITGIAVSDLHKAAELLALNKPMAVIFAMGITQHVTGVMNVLSLANLQMLLGNMGVPGGGVNPLRGQNNVQGACDMGCLPDVLPGYQKVADSAVRERFNVSWRLSGGNCVIPDRPGLTVTEMTDLAGEGKVRSLYILGENVAMSDPDLNHLTKSMAACELTVLQEIFPSETMKFADVVLPGVSWAEKNGTFTNTERRIQMVRKAVEPPGEARDDWRITTELAQRILSLQDCKSEGPQAAWDYSSPEAIMEEIAALTPSYAGASHARLEQGEQLHWPITHTRHSGTPILHIGTFTRGKGRFYPVEHVQASELPDKDFPLYLTTGRVLYHWHGAEMTRRANALLSIYPESLVEISAEDALKIGLNGHKVVRVVSRRGEMIARAQITDRVPPGLVFGNFHFPDQQNVNNLTNAALDPVAKIPEYKVCGVRIEAFKPTNDVGP